MRASGVARDGSSSDRQVRSGPLKRLETATDGGERRQVRALVRPFARSFFFSRATQGHGRGILYLADDDSTNSTATCMYAQRVRVLPRTRNGTAEARDARIRARSVSRRATRRTIAKRAASRPLGNSPLSLSLCLSFPLTLVLRSESKSTRNEHIYSTYLRLIGIYTSVIIPSDRIGRLFFRSFPLPPPSLFHP